MEAPRRTRNPWIAAWNGDARKGIYLALWFPALALLWAGCFLLAARTYCGYEITTHDISALGDPGFNPRGWSWWSIGMGIAAVLIYSPIAHASRRMRELTTDQSRGTRRLVSIGAVCMRCGCLGMAGLALAPQRHGLGDLLHVIAGVFAFGGVYVTLLFFWSVPLFRVRDMSAVRLTLFTLSAWWAVIGYLSTQGFRYFAYGEAGHDLKHRGESILLRFSLWEWMLFAALVSSFAVLVAVLPTEMNPRHTRPPT
jgi:hypothetical protein